MKIPCKCQTLQPTFIRGTPKLSRSFTTPEVSSHYRHSREKSGFKQGTFKKILPICTSFHFAIRRPHFWVWRSSNMAGWYFLRMLLLLNIVAHMFSYNDTDQCHVCQTPLIQNPRVPWQHLLTNTTYVFSGLRFVKKIRVLPNNSFVAGTYIQVCIQSIAHWKG